MKVMFNGSSTGFGHGWRTHCQCQRSCQCSGGWPCQCQTRCTCGQRGATPGAAAPEPPAPPRADLWAEAGEAELRRRPVRRTTPFRPSPALPFRQGGGASATVAGWPASSMRPPQQTFGQAGHSGRGKPGLPRFATLNNQQAALAFQQQKARQTQWLNHALARHLGWGRHLSRIATVIGCGPCKPGSLAFMQALARWQARRGLTATGVLSGGVWAMLRRLLQIQAAGRAARPFGGVTATSALAFAAPQAAPAAPSPWPAPGPATSTGGTATGSPAEDAQASAASDDWPDDAQDPFGGPEAAGEPTSGEPASATNDNDVSEPAPMPEPGDISPEDAEFLLPVGRRERTRGVRW
jgi:drug/metabolite transporter superfamily protein YnfA